MVLIVDNEEDGKAAIDIMVEGRAVSHAVHLERLMCLRAETECRNLVENCKKVERW